MPLRRYRGGDPIKTGVVAFVYSLRTALLPFLFIFNTDLLLIDVTPLQGVFVFIIATIAILLFTAGTQGYFLVRNKFYESILLILVAFSFFRPGFWMDYIVPPFTEENPASIVEVIGSAEVGSELRFIVQGEDDVGEEVVFTALMSIGEETTGEERLEAYGLDILMEDGAVLIDNAAFDSEAQNAGLDFDQKILTVLAPVDQPAKQLIYLPTLLLLGLVIMLQRRRRDISGDAVASSS